MNVHVCAVRICVCVCMFIYTCVLNACLNVNSNPVAESENYCHI